MKRLFMSFIPLLLVATTPQAATLPAIADIAVHAKVEIESGHRAAEVFEHFVSECGEQGNVVFLGTVKHNGFSRLTLLSGQEAASYIETDGDGKYPWLLACEGAERFLVEKDHRYGTADAKFRLYRGRALEGVDYASSRPTGGESAPPTGLDDTVFALKMAADLSEYGMDFVATNADTRFVGRMEQRAGGCDTVSITRFVSGSDEGTAQAYRVCSGSAYAVGGPLVMKAAR